MGRARKVREQYWLEWINQKDLDQLEWAAEYLAEKGLHSTRRHPNAAVTLRHIPEPSFPHPTARDKFIDLMKKAWKAKQGRSVAKTKGIKALHIYLPETAIEALRNHSHRLNQPMNQILADLISHTLPRLGDMSPTPLALQQRRSQHSPVYYGADEQPPRGDGPPDDRKTTTAAPEILEKIAELQKQINTLREQVPIPSGPQALTPTWVAETNVGSTAKPSSPHPGDALTHPDSNEPLKLDREDNKLVVVGTKTIYGGETFEIVKPKPKGNSDDKF